MMFQNIVIAGGSTSFCGFQQRLQEELAESLPHHIIIAVDDSNNKTNTVWTGGAILMRTSITDWNWVSKENYSEIGENIIHRMWF